MNPRKVLAAEDDAFARSMLEQILVDQLNFELQMAKNGEEAWQLLLQGWKPDFCVFDIRMPELNGLDLTRRLRADDRFKRLPVLLCTAMSESDAIDAAVALDVVAYIVKPYKAETLVKEIKELFHEI